MRSGSLAAPHIARRSPSDWPSQMKRGSLITDRRFLPTPAVLVRFRPPRPSEPLCLPPRHLFISLSISLTSAHLAASLRLSLHCNKTLVRQFMFCSPRPESSPATIASCGSRQWVAAVRQRYLRLKLHTLCFPTCPPFRRPVLCPEALADTGPPILKPGMRGGQTFVNGGNPLLTFSFFLFRETRFVLCGPRRQTGDIPSVKLDRDNLVTMREETLDNSTF